MPQPPSGSCFLSIPREIQQAVSFHAQLHRAEGQGLQWALTASSALHVGLWKAVMASGYISQVTPLLPWPPACSGALTNRCHVCATYIVPSRACL